MKTARRAACCALLTFGLLAVEAPIGGSWALQDGAPKTQGFLTATARGDPLEQHLDLWMTPAAGGAPIRRYTLDMTKLLHVIVVSDDFEHFLHIHPTLGPDGHFSIDTRFPTPALYHVYADGEPADYGQQVFRFDLPVAGGTAVPARALSPTGTIVSTGPYTVTLSATSVAAGRESDLVVHVLRDGEPARDLHPYLGALAHAVFLNGSDLTYIHVHPTQLGAAPMNGMTMGGMAGMEMPPLPDTAPSAPDMQLRVRLRKAGRWKLWLQFRGAGELHVAPFVVDAR